MAVLRWGATTDPGRVRTENEDTFVTEPMVFAVADGMGGHQAGEVASALAASIVRDRLGAGATSEDAAAAAVGEANAAIYGAAKANPAQSGMGTTLTAMAILTEDSSDGEERFVLLNVGDSRTYRFRAGRLQRVTVDHSYVQELVAAGHISLEEARTHPRRNIVTRALGIEPVVRADMWTLPLVRGDRFILASDGLVDEVPDHEILDLVEATEDPQELSKQLVDIANRHGGRDNVTVVVVDGVEGADPPDPTDELQFDPAWSEGIEEPLWGDDDSPPDAPSTADVITADEEAGAAAITVRDATAMPTAPPPPPNDDELAPVLPPPVGAPADDAPTVADAAGVDAGTGAEGDGPATTTTTADAPVMDTADTAPAMSAAAAAVAPLVGGMRIADSAKAPGSPAPDAGSTSGPTIDPKHGAAAKPKRRRFTFGVFLFAFLIAAILTVTVTLIAVHARSGYFVGFDDDTVVIYKGQRERVLWFEPTVDQRSAKTRDQLAPQTVNAVEANPTFDSPREAEAFITDLVPTTTTTVVEATTTTSTTVVDTTTPVESTTTTAPEGG